MYLPAIISTIAAWFLGLIIDVNIDVGDPVGILNLRVLFPVLVMGIFILRAFNRNDPK